MGTVSGHSDRDSRLGVVRASYWVAFHYREYRDQHRTSVVASAPPCGRAYIAAVVAVHQLGHVVVVAWSGEDTYPSMQPDCNTTLDNTSAVVQVYYVVDDAIVVVDEGIVSVVDVEPPLALIAELGMMMLQ